MITHPKSAVAFCPGGGVAILRGAATHLKGLLDKGAVGNAGISFGLGEFCFAFCFSIF